MRTKNITKVTNPDNKSWERVSKLKEFFGLPWRTFETNVGMSNGGIVHRIKDDRPLTIKTLKKICSVYPANLQWLTTGEGSVFRVNESAYYRLLEILFQENTSIRDFEKINGNKKGEFMGAIQYRPINSILKWTKDVSRLFPNHDYSILSNPLSTITADYTSSLEKTQNVPMTQREQYLCECIKILEGILDNDVSSISKDNYKGCTENELIFHFQDFNFIPQSEIEEKLFYLMVTKYKKLFKILDPARIAAFLNQNY